MKEVLVDGGVLAVNGHVPGLSVRAVLQQVASAMRLPRRSPASRPFEVCLASCIALGCGLSVHRLWSCPSSCAASSGRHDAAAQAHRRDGHVTALDGICIFCRPFMISPGAARSRCGRWLCGCPAKLCSGHALDGSADPQGQIYCCFSSHCCRSRPEETD